MDALYVILTTAAGGIVGGTVGCLWPVDEADLYDRFVCATTGALLGTATGAVTGSILFA